MQEPKLEGNYKGKVRGVTPGSGDSSYAPSPKEAPMGHTLCEESYKKHGGNPGKMVGTNY